MRFIIIEKDEDVFNQLSAYIHKMEEEYPFLEQVQIEWCVSGEQIRNDCCLDGELCVVIDLDLLDCSGMELAEELRKQDESLLLVICSAVNDYAMQCYDLDVVYYLLKPLTEQAVRLMLTRILRRRETDEV